ncbi:40S ribosomal protein mrp10 [Neophaeococcomyces mojaviensis]|uniref:40S ribosomal protein mrp10 n=1 Tax=Neophaeococcomyces mojaviensis TaxID=3383035 RepID=A0ACC2ZV95_9EURO|nr:40S ribosomal protein mrp10 [Knufia sp. JES_112]
MPPKGVSTAVSPIRLQSVTRLKIRHPDKQEANPCIGPMTAMLSCWASSANAANTTGCAHLEKALRECMDKPRSTSGHKSNINYHLGRLYPQVAPPKKRKGSLG